MSERAARLAVRCADVASLDAAPASIGPVLAAWNAETPVPEDVRRQVQDELDRVGLTARPGRDDQLAG